MENFRPMEDVSAFQPDAIYPGHRPATLVLADGREFHGYGFGAQREVVAEIVFTTAPCGYVEALSDPSYGGQGVVLTFPELGNYGVSADMMEAEHLSLSAVLVRQIHEGETDPRAERRLDEWLREAGIPGMFGINTRALTFHLRKNGSMKGKICFTPFEKNAVLREIEAWRMPFQVGRLSTPKIFHVDADPTAIASAAQAGRRTKRIALLDYGAKQSMIRRFVDLGCDVTVYPYDSPCSVVLEDKPDGIFLTNGPGDPMDCSRSIHEIQGMIASGIPIFAICLGHQMLALAAGARTRKMRFGHRGINHPVRDCRSGKLLITSQNHGYVVEREGLAELGLEVSYESVQDGSVEGLRFIDKPISSVQFHPEAHPGPNDSQSIFADFVRNL